MPWLRTGTVACTLNSTTVTGTGTGFVANARVGDAFLGPDGRWYEVVNIASDTALSILPAYLGATVSAGAYALAPMQGYVKAAADKLNALVAQFGALAASASINALAAVTGTAGMVPYFTAGDAMGLIRLTASQTDTTVGRLVKVGDFGGNGGDCITLSNTVDWDTLTVPGDYYIALASGNNAPGAIAGYIKIRKSGTLIKQVVTQQGQPTEYQRAYNGANWVAWGRSVNTSNLIGTVSQAAGVPTGAVIEKGSNANGSYVKFADGTMICYGRASLGNIAITSAFGSWFISALQAARTLPATFAAAPTVTYSLDNTGNVAGIFSAGPSSTTSTPYFYLASGSSNTLPATLNYIAIGTWY